MGLEFIILALCLTGLAGTYYLWDNNRSVQRLFALLCMATWTYIAVVLVIIRMLQPGLLVMLVLGGLPVFLVAYGYRYYEEKYGKPQPPKRKNDNL